MHWVASPFVVLARAHAELLELVKRPAIDVQDPGILGDALEERVTIGEWVYDSPFRGAVNDV